MEGKTLARILAAAVGVCMALSLFAFTRSCADRHRLDRWYADHHAADPALGELKLPDSLPETARDIFVRRDTAHDAAWARFDVEPPRRPVLEKAWQAATVDPVTVTDPGRVLWWPKVLSGQLTRDQIRGAGFDAYRVKQRREDPEARGWMFVDWRAGRAYYWLPGT